MSLNSPVRLAMWSGPRNISTAMMRAWGSRTDTFVCDEPLYAFYLKATGKPHPIAEQIIAHYENDWCKVCEWLTGVIPEGRSIFFQKHMTHHLLPEVDREWLRAVTNCFLIRHPRDVITSYVRKNGVPTLEDLGFAQQADIFRWVCDHTGQTPVVVDAQDVSNEPRKTLGLLCDAVGVGFQDAMLSWSPGLHPSDGLWARHWYTEVESSTGFRPYREKSDEVPESLQTVYEQCLNFYEQLSIHRLR